MEARLSAALGANGQSTDAVAADAASTKVELTEELVAAESPRPEQLENGANVWPDESAETSFLSDQREQGVVEPPVAASDASEEADSKTPLPALDELVKKISPAAREAMDELFRAKFVSVRRVPKKVLKE